MRDRDAALRYQRQHYGADATITMRNAFSDVFKRIGGWSPPGAVREAFADKKYRWVPIAPYPYSAVWTYGQNEGDRVIVRILHASMDLETAMDRTEPWS